MDSSRDHGIKVQHIFRHIAGVYDGLNTIFSLGQDAVWRRKLAKAALEGLDGNCPPVLDLAAGTLKVTQEMARRKPGLCILAADFCPPMLQKGLASLKKLPESRILALAGDATSLPFPDNSMAAVTVAFGLRNFKPRDAALREMHRVLIPGGKVCVLEFGSARDRILFGLYNWYLANVLPLAGKLVSRDKEAYQYLADTIAAFPSADELAREMAAEGFHHVGHQPFTAGIVRLHTGIKPRTSEPS